ncbi:MAG: hypothetical protein WDW38_006381 [Sanguina aurantia]
MASDAAINCTAIASELNRRLGPHLTALSHPAMNLEQTHGLSDLADDMFAGLSLCKTSPPQDPADPFFTECFLLRRRVTALMRKISARSVSSTETAAGCEALGCLVCSLCILSISVPYMDTTLDKAMFFLGVEAATSDLEEYATLFSATYWTVNAPKPVGQPAITARYRLQTCLLNLLLPVLQRLSTKSLQVVVRDLSSKRQHLYLQQMLLMMAEMLILEPSSAEMGERILFKVLVNMRAFTRLIATCQAAELVHTADGLFSPAFLHLVRQLLSMGVCVPETTKQQLVAMLGTLPPQEVLSLSEVAPHLRRLQPVCFSKFLQGMNGTKILPPGALRFVKQSSWLIPAKSVLRRDHEESHSGVLNLSLMLLRVIKAQQQEEQQKEQQQQQQQQQEEEEEEKYNFVQLYNFLNHVWVSRESCVRNLSQSALSDGPCLRQEGLALLGRQPGVWGGYECALRGLSRTPARTTSTLPLVSLVLNALTEKTPAAALICLAVTVRKLCLLNTRGSTGTGTGTAQSCDAISMCPYAMDYMICNRDTMDPALEVVAKALAYIWVDACSGMTKCEVSLCAPTMRASRTGTWVKRLLPRVAQQAVCGVFAESDYAKVGYCGNGVCDNLSGCTEAALPTLLCAGCRRVRYCSEECQRQAWVGGGHRDRCGTPRSL